jgi:ribulose-phosphate 3-epimerase
MNDAAPGRPIRIAPSLLACDFARLAEEIARVEEAGADWLHVDVMDGHFVPNLTIGPPVVEAMAKVATKPLDVHLMISDPWTYTDRFLDAGAAGVTFHVETVGAGADHTVEQGRELLAHIRSRGARAGLSLNPDRSVAELEPLLGDADLVLVMSVFAGFGGQKFMPEVLETVRWLRARDDWAGEIEIDGGIGPGTIAQAAEAGANVFVAGTAVFGAPDVRARIAELRGLAERAGAGAISE